MVVTAVVAEAVGLDHRTAARMVALTTVLSIFTVPWWHGVIAGL
jgi:predicted permease